MKEWLVAYFTFSKKERTGVLVLVGLILLIWLLPEYYKKPDPIDPGILKKADSVIVAELTPGKGEPGNTVSKLFYFDPNTITAGQWMELGLSERTVSIIRNYVSKGGKFREPSDLKKIYGIKKEDAERLIPYVRITKLPGRAAFAYPQHFAQQPARSFNNFPRKPFQRKTYSVDLNEADSIALEALPGIGEKLASRIVRFRELLGGFYSVDQLKDVYGINDTIFNLVSPSLTLHSGIFRKIRINDWDADSLDLHPYIRRHEARAIVKYRSQHGRFKLAEDLEALGMIDAEWINRLKPYMEFD